MANEKAVELLIKLKDEASKNAEKISDAINELNGTTDKNTKKNEKNEKSLKLSAKASDLGQKAFLGLSAGVLAGAAAFTKFTVDMIAMNKELTEFSRLSGVSKSVLQSLNLEFGAQGLNLDKISSAINDVNIKLQEAALENSGDLYNLSGMLGLDVQALAALDDPAKAFDAITNSMRNLSKEQQKVFADKFGSDNAILLTQALIQNGQTIDGLTQKYENSGKILDESFLKNIEKFDKTLIQSSAATKAYLSESTSVFIGVADEILNNFLNSTNNVTEKTTNKFNELLKFFVYFFSEFNKKYIKYFEKPFKDFYDVILKPLAEDFEQIFNIIKYNFDTLINSLQAGQDKLKALVTLDFEAVDKAEVQRQIRQMSLDAKNEVDRLIYDKKYNTRAQDINDNLLKNEKDKNNELEKDKNIRENLLNIIAKHEKIQNDIKNGVIATTKETDKLVNTTIKVPQIYDDFISSLSSITDKLDLVVGTEAEKVITKQLFNKINNYKKDLQDALNNAKSDALLFVGKDLNEEDQNQYNNALIRIQTYQSNIEALNNKTLNLRKTYTSLNSEFFNALQIINENVESNMTSTIQNMINDFDNFGDYLKSFVLNILSDLQQAFIQQQITNPAKNYLNSLMNNAAQAPSAAPAEAAPAEAAQAAVAESLAGEIDLTKTTDQLKEGVQDAFNDVDLSSIFSDMGSFFSGIFDSLSSSLSSLFSGSSGSTGGFFAAIGSLFGAAHSGGVIGSDTLHLKRKVNPSVFSGATKYHTGGIVGLTPNEVPIIAKKGEEVLTANDPRHINNFDGGDGRRQNTNVNVNNTVAIGDDDIGKMLNRDSSVSQIIKIINKNKDKINI